MMTDFLSQTRIWKPKNNSIVCLNRVFKVLEEKEMGAENSRYSKHILQNIWNKDILRETKAKRLTERSSSGWRKIIPDGTRNLRERIKSIRKVNIHKRNRPYFYICIFSVFKNNYWLHRSEIITMYYKIYSYVTIK